MADDLREVYAQTADGNVIESFGFVEDDALHLRLNVS